MIKSVKRCLRKTVGQAKLSLEELQIHSLKLRLVLNSRPLSYISAKDLEEPLTPSHLLMGRQVLSFPDNLGYSQEPDEDFEANTLKRTLTSSIGE